MTNDNQEGFDDEAIFHQALSYMIERYSGVHTSSLKHILSLFNPELVERLFSRRECHRILMYISETNERYTNSKLYESITFNGATYEVVDDNGQMNAVGYTYFDWIKEIEKVEIQK